MRKEAAGTDCHPDKSSRSLRETEGLDGVRKRLSLKGLSAEVQVPLEFRIRRVLNHRDDFTVRILERDRFQRGDFGRSDDPPRAAFHKAGNVSDVPEARLVMDRAVLNVAENRSSACVRDVAGTAGGNVEDKVPVCPAAAEVIHVVDDRG